MTISYWLDKKIENKTTSSYDVLIIGAGILGAATAYWLSTLKNFKGLNIAVLEMKRKGQCASGRNGGFVLRGIVAYYNEAVRRYGRENAAWIFRFNEETQQHLVELVTKYHNAFELEQSGSYLLASSIDELHDLEESCQLMQEDGFDVTCLKEDPLDRGYYGALNNPCDLALNPYKLLDFLFEKSSCKLFEEQEVFRIDTQENGLIVHTQESIYQAEKVLVTTNAYLPLLMPNFAQYINVERGQIIVTRPLKEVLVNKLCYANYGFEYFRQLSDGRFLLGGCREVFREQEIGYADTISQPVQNALLNYLKIHFPEIAGVAIDYKWSGLMGFTEDGLPIMGEIPEKKGLHFVAGCNGHGMGYSLALAKLFCEYSYELSSPAIFDFKRFKLNI